MSTLARYLAVVFLSAVCCVEAAAQAAAPYQFNGIVLDSPEAELPKTYQTLFRGSDCRHERLGQKPVKRCAKEFPPQTLPGLPRDIKGPVNFHLNYVDGRLQQIGFGLRRDDYAAFVASLTKEHGNPRFVHMVEMDSVKEKQYTWNRARYSIATYAFYPDTAKSAVFYSVIEPIDKQLLKSLGVKPSGDNKQ